MATFKVTFQRTTDFVGYIESDEGIQGAVNKLMYPCDRDSDGKITTRYAPGDRACEIMKSDSSGKIISVLDIGADRVVTEEEIPEAVAPEDF